MVKRNTISELLLGDSLGELVAKLNVGDPEARLIVIIATHAGGIRMAASENISKPEQIGILYLSIDQLSMEARE